MLHVASIPWPRRCLGGLFFASDALSARSPQDRPPNRAHDGGAVRDEAATAD
ncbi:MAG: hypothetical protein ACLT98_16790 [Eggerthellaceae bacterium]